MLYKLGVLKNLAEFTEKHLWWSVFNKQKQLPEVLYEKSCS